MAEYNPSKIIKDGNTYNFRDTTKIPLSGTNALSGSIVPDTDYAYDFGDSSHNYKIVYAKEIRHGLNSGSLVCSGGNGTTNGANLVLYGTNRSDGFQGRFDLVAKGSTDYKLTGLPSGTLTWGNKDIDIIEEQGDGYIRYSNGLQICWGHVDSSIVAWVDLLFPKPFKDAIIYMTATQVYSASERDNFKNASVGVTVYSNTTFSVTVYDSSFWSVNFYAIGHWK